MSIAAWHPRAACKGMSAEASDAVFFPSSAVLMTPGAQQACGNCTVREACLDWAIETRQEYGIYGGMCPEERKAERRRRTRRMAHPGREAVA